MSNTERIETSEIVRSQSAESMARRATKARLSVLLGKYEAETEKERKQELAERIWSLVHRIRFGDFGFSPQGALAAALVCTLVAATALWHFWPKGKFYSWPDDYLRVVENLDPCESDGTCGYRRVMQEVVDGVPQRETQMLFCEKPRFEAGQILEWNRFIQRGSCTVVDGWNVLRENKTTFVNGAWHKLPILAPPCRFDWTHNHVACPEGRAKF